MNRSLKALAALSILSFSACASTGVEDELAGESSDDAALDGKADGAIDGAYTYFEVFRDLRKCAAPSCGGFYVYQLNRSTTVCHNGVARTACYIPNLDWAEAKLAATQQTTLLDAASKGAVSNGTIAIVRGRFAPQTYGSFGNLGRFIVTEAWVAVNGSVSEGVFTRVHDNGIRCIKAPCPSIGEKALNSSRTANVHGLDWSAGGFDDDTIAELSAALVDSPAGILISGDRYTYTENGSSAKGRTVTAAYRKLAEPTGN